jgi:ATP-dependent helicase/nuclease subunit A
MRFIDSSGPAITPVARAADPGAPRCEWRAELAARYDELDRLLAGTPAARSFLAAATGKSASNSDEMPIDPARDRGVRIGLAFHAAMYLLDLARDPNSAQAAQEAGVRQRLDGAAICTLQEMLERTLDSALMQRARASLTAGRRIWRELPYVRSCGRNGAEIEEGKIDLLIEEPDGCVLVDYKTDLTQPEGEILGKYEAQLKAYASSLRSLGITVKSAHLLLARSGHEVEIPL